jgi:hypothetical protein
MAIDCLWSTHKRCWNTEAETQMLKHRTQCWNTNAGTQMLKHSAETELEHRTQMVKVVIDGNRLVMEHAQVLEHKC